MYKGRREFRAGRTSVVVAVSCTALFAIVALVSQRTRGWDWVTILLAGVTVVVGLGAIVENLVLRIRLTDDALIVTDLRGTRRYDIAIIEGIEEAKGCPPALRFRDGTWVKLPSVGASLGNSVRAWLKQ